MGVNYHIGNIMQEGIIILGTFDGKYHGIVYDKHVELWMSAIQTVLDDRQHTGHVGNALDSHVG